jgi:hypothetical protein
MEELTEEEKKAVASAIRGSIDLWGRYVKLQPESTGMKRKQSQKRKAVEHLKSALAKLR